MEQTEKPHLSICAQCAKEFNLDKLLLQASYQGRVGVTHTICKRHLLQQLVDAKFPPVEARRAVFAAQKTRGTLPPDLASRPDLVKSYGSGDFTLKERIQKLAGI